MRLLCWLPEPISRYIGLALVVLVASSTTSLAQDLGPEDTEAVPDETQLEPDTSTDNAQTRPDAVTADELELLDVELLEVFLEDPLLFMETREPVDIARAVELAVVNDPEIIDIVLSAEPTLDNEAKSAAIADGVASALVRLSAQGRSDETARIIGRIALIASSSFGTLVNQVLAELDSEVPEGDEGGDGTAEVIVAPEVLVDPVTPPPSIGSNLAGAGGGGDGAVPIGGYGSDFGGSASNNSTSGEALGVVSSGGVGGDGTSSGEADDDVSPVD